MPMILEAESWRWKDAHDTIYSEYLIYNNRLSEEMTVILFHSVNLITNHRLLFYFMNMITNNKLVEEMPMIFFYSTNLISKKNHLWRDKHDTLLFCKFDKQQKIIWRYACKSDIQQETNLNRCPGYCFVLFYFWSSTIGYKESTVLFYKSDNQLQIIWRDSHDIVLSWKSYIQQNLIWKDDYDTVLFCRSATNK